MNERIITLTRKAWLKAGLLELFLVSRNDIPREYTREELVHNLLDEMMFLNSFKGDEDEFKRFGDFLSAPANSDRLFKVYKKTLDGLTPTIEDVEFVEGFKVLKERDYQVTDPSAPYLAVHLLQGPEGPSQHFVP